MMEAKRRPFDPHITWAGDYCKHCYTCINICPVKNLKFKGDEIVSLHKCIQCQLCEKYCPDFALEVKPKAPAAKKSGTRAVASEPAPAAKKRAGAKKAGTSPGPPAKSGPE